MRYVLHGKEKKDIVNNQITPPLGLSGPLFLTYFYGTGDGAGDIGMGEVGICTLTCLARGGRTVELQWCWIAERVVGSCLTLNCAQGANGHAPNPHPARQLLLACGGGRHAPCRGPGGGKNVITATLRQLETLIRLSEAHAKLHLCALMCWLRVKKAPQARVCQCRHTEGRRKPCDGANRHACHRAQGAFICSRCSPCSSGSGCLTFLKSAVQKIWGDPGSGGKLPLPWVRASQNACRIIRLI
jgi:hypothetical protein